MSVCHLHARVVLRPASRELVFELAPFNCGMKLSRYTTPKASQILSKIGTFKHRVGLSLSIFVESGYSKYIVCLRRSSCIGRLTPYALLACGYITEVNPRTLGLSFL